MLSLPHCHRHIMIYVVQIVRMILGRMCLLHDLHFTLLYIVVSQQFDMQSYQTSCLNAHNHNTCTHLPPTRLYCPKDGILHYLSRSVNTSTSRQCHGNHHNNRLLWSFLPAKCHTVSACNYPSEHVAIWGYLGRARLLQPKTKQGPIF